MIFMHSIMHYQIFISVQNKAENRPNSLRWVTKSQIRELNPSSLIQKVLEH